MGRGDRGVDIDALVAAWSSRKTPLHSAGNKVMPKRIKSGVANILICSQVIAAVERPARVAAFAPSGEEEMARGRLRPRRRPGTTPDSRQCRTQTARGRADWRGRLPQCRLSGAGLGSLGPAGQASPSARPTDRNAREWVYVAVPGVSMDFQIVTGIKLRVWIWSLPPPRIEKVFERIDAGLDDIRIVCKIVGCIKFDKRRSIWARSSGRSESSPEKALEFDAALARVPDRRLAR